MVPPLNADLLHNILQRLDGLTLARAACACADFSSISKQESLWQNACKSLWPSTNRQDVQALISSIGGFRKFYSDCFPLLSIKHIPPNSNTHLPYPEEWIEDYFYGDFYESENISPLDFISIVDVKYKDKHVYSKVLWEITDSSSYNGWFFNCPFRIDINDEFSIFEGLPLVESIERERKDGKLWKELYENIKLSWIIVNKRLGQAANVASWGPLGGQRHWPTDRDFLLRFGSILPAKNILPCQVAECILVMRFRVVDGEVMSLKMTELSMQLEDMGGAHVNGWNSLLVLKEALGCQRSRNYSEVLEHCHLYLKARSKFKEERMRSESLFDSVCVISGIAAFASLCYCVM